jgi:hypothetical protein
MPTKKRPPDDAACSPTDALGSAALGALSGGNDALGGRHPSAHLPSTCAEEMRRPYPSGAPEGNSNIRSHTDRGTVGDWEGRIGENRARAAAYARGRRPRSGMRRTPSWGGRREAED